MNKPDIQQLNKHIDKLFIECLKVASPIHTIYLIREKINDRGLQQPDKGAWTAPKNDGKINSEMLAIHDLLKQMP